MGSKEAGNIVIKMRLETAELKAGIATAQRSLKSLSTTAQNVGKSLSVAFTLPLAGLGAAAVKSFSNFDSAMTRSIAIMGKAGQAMKAELIKGAEDVAKSTKFSATEAAEGYYFLAAAGIRAEAAIKALPVVARFATNANIGMAQASDQLVDTLNAVGLASKDADENMKGMIRVSNVLTRAAMDTNVSIGDLASSFAGPLGGSMRQNHIEIETAAAALEALGQQGIKAKVSGTALGIVIRELGLKAVKNADAFKQQGIEVFDSAGRFRNFIDIMGDLEKRLKGVSDVERISVLDKLGFTLKNIGFVTMFLGLTDRMREFEAANKEANYEAELFAENMKSFANQFAIIKNSLMVVANQIGADLAPTILELGRAAVKAAEWFKALPEGTRKAIEGFLAFLAIAGPITFFFGNLGAAVLGFTRLLAPLVVGLAKVAAGFLGVNLAALALPALIVGAFAGVGALVYVFWDDIKQAGEDVVDWFATEFPTIAKYAEAAWVLIRDSATEAWDWIKQTASALGEWMSGWWNSTIDGMSNTWKRFEDASAQIWANLKVKAQEWATWFASFFPEWVTNAAQKAADGVKNIVKGVDKSLSDSANINAQMYGAMSQSVSNYTDEILAAERAKEKAVKDATTGWNGAAMQEEWNALSQQVLTLGDINKLVRERTTLNALNVESEKEVHQMSIEERMAAEEAAKAAEKAAKEREKAIKDQAKAMKELQDALSKTINKDSVEDVKEALDSAIKEGVSDAAFQALSKKLYDSVYKGYVEGAQDAIERAGGTQEAKDLVNQAAAIKAQEAVDDITAKQIEANTKIAEDKAEKDKQAYEDSVEFFKDIFSKAVDSSSYDFREALKDIFVQLGAELAAMLSSAINGGSFSAGAGGTSTAGGASGGMGNIIGSLGGLLGLTGGETSIASGTTGIGPVADGEAYGNAIGGGKYTSEAALASYAQVIGAAISAGGTDKATKSNEGTGGAIGAAIGTAILPGVGTAIGQAIGGMAGSMIKWGPQNPETLARHAFANFIESSFAKMGQVSFYGPDGHLKNVKGSQFNFLENISDFNSKGSENSVSKLNALGAQARGTFLGLGLAMKETLGLTDAVGEHLGAMLADNLGGNVDNARLLFQQLGLSLDDMVEKLVALGRSGAQSWLEIETAIQGVTEASKPGLVAFADYQGAFQGLIESGGRGVAALKGVKDVAQEGIEAGAQSLEQLKGMMLNSGLDAEQVNAYFDAVKNRGITSLQELAAVSDRVGGGIVADMNANSASLAAMWAEMGNQLNDIKQKIQDIPTDVVTNYRIKVTTEVDSNGQKVLDGGAISLPQNSPTTIPHAKGAIITGPIGFGGNHVMGESGPEGLLPLARTGDGSLGVRIAGGKGRSEDRGATIVINAPYATPGTAEHIRRAVLELEPYLTSRAVDKTIKVANRGGRIGRSIR